MRRRVGGSRVSARAMLVTNACSIALVLGSAAAAPSDDTLGEAERRCALAVLAARVHVQSADTRTLARCALAVMSHANGEDTEVACRRLRTAFVGTDLVDRRASKRVAEWCASARPRWLAAYCEGPGPWSGIPLVGAADLARCVVSSTHCVARQAVESVLGALEEHVGVENPDNLLFEYGEVDGNSFAGCRAASTSAFPE